MSYYHNDVEPELESIAALAVDAKEITVSYTILNDVPDSHKRLDYLVYITSTDTYYRWDPTILPSGDWEVAIPSTTTGVNSVTAGTNISVTGTVQVPVVSTIASPSFTQVSSTAPLPLVNSDLTRKDYVDNANNLDLKKSANLSDLANKQTALSNLTGCADAVKTNGQLLIGDGIDFTTNTLTGTANQVIVTNGAGSVTLSLPQNINTTAQPIFNRITSSLAPTALTDCTNKNYVDTLDGANVKSVTTSNSSILSITGTAQNPILNPLMGGGDALLYQYRTATNNPSANEIKFNNILFASMSEMKIHYTAINRYDAEYLKQYLETQLEAMPFKVCLIDKVDGTHYAEFYITSIVNIGTNFITYGCSYDVANSFITGGGPGGTQFADGLEVRFFMIDVQRLISAGTRMSVAVVNPKQVVISTTAELNTVLNVGIGTGTIYKNKVGENFNLKTLIAGTGTTIINGTDDITIASTGEINTMSNVGTGIGQVFRDKTGVNFNMKTLVPGTNMAITNATNEIIISSTLNPTASTTQTNTSNFNNRLSIADTTCQLAIDTLDNYIETDNTVNNTPGSRVYGIGAKVLNALDGLDTQCQSLQTNKIDTITSSHTGVINVSGTGASRAIEPRTGAQTPFLYYVGTGFNDGSNIVFNALTASAVFSIGLGWLPVNRSIYSDDYVRWYHEDLLLTPCRLTIIDSVDQNNRAVYDIVSYTAGVNAHILSVNYISSTGTPSTTLGSYHAILSRKIPSIGQELQRNWLEQCCLNVYNFGTQIVPSLVSSNQYGSLTVQMPGPNGWNSMIALSGPKSFRALSHNSPKIRYFAIQLAGTGWNGAQAQNIWIGLAAEGAFRSVKNWGISSVAFGENVPWSLTATSSEKIHRGRLSSAPQDVLWAYGGTIQFGGSRYGNLSYNTFNQNDVLLYWMNTNHQFQFEVRNASNSYAPETGGFINSPDGLSMNSNFLGQGITPNWSQTLTGAAYEVKVLSQRECDVLGITVTDAENYFY